MSEHDYDAIVLGGGPGGYVCAIRLAQLGQKVVCVEEDEFGGVCLNWGCIPSKALISNAHFFTKARQMSEHGIVVGSVEVDPDRMQRWKDGLVKKLTNGVRQLLRSNGAQIVEGTGKLIEPSAIEVKSKNGESLRLRARKAIVVATGSATIQIPGFEFDGSHVIGAREAVSLRRVPRRLVVIGGGVIGLELGMVYQSFGSQVSIVELTPNLLPGTDPDAVRIVERVLKKRGAHIFKGAKAQGCSTLEDGSLSVAINVGGKTQSLECDTLLVAVGMKPRSRDIGLEALGVAIDERGFIVTDERCQTSAKGIYAVGDVSGPPMLAHKASKEGEVCAEVIAGRAAAKDWITVPGIIFTDPEIASAGLSEEQATEQGLRVKVGRFPFSALGRAMSIGETDGFVKVVRDEKSGRVVGVHIVGPSASDLISEGALAVEMAADALDVAMTIHPHPTLGEAMMEASQASLGHAIHMMNR